MADIKKAWEQMKKDLKKELGISGGFTMNAKQLQNRTATYLSVNLLTYDEEIQREKKSDERVQGYDSWTAEEKAANHERAVRTIEIYEALKAKYGTKENQAKTEMHDIVNSKAFEKFQSAVGKVSTTIEMKENFYLYIRFNY